MATLSGLVASAFLLTAFFLWRAFHCIRRRQVLRAGANSLSCLFCGVLLGAALLLGVSYHGYQRLTAEQAVARIGFSRLDSGNYRARLMVTGQADRFFVLAGDEWQIDARMVSWQPPATILGLDPLYRLDRLSGRFADLDLERNARRTVYRLSEPPLLDIWSVAQRLPTLAPGVDAYYGTATYVPLVDGAVWEVSISRDALIARPANPAAERSLSSW